MSSHKTVLQLTCAQAIVRYLASQPTDIDGESERLFGGGFGIFGHGNAPCLDQARFEHRAALPLYRGQNDQGMGFAARRLARKGRPLRPKALRPPSSHPSAAKRGARTQEFV